MVLNWLSLNVQSLNSHQKCAKVFRYLWSHKVGTACLQETHFASSSTPHYFDAQYRQVYHAMAPSKTRGIQITFHNEVLFIRHKTISDPQGRYLLLLGSLMDLEGTLCSYYAPNEWRQLPFLSHLFELLHTHTKGTLLPCGDIWRKLHPFAGDYMHYSHTHASNSQIDHVLVPRQLIPQVLSATILTVPWSDHDPILVTCNSYLIKPPSSSWCLNDSLLSQSSLIADLRLLSVGYIQLNVGSVQSLVTLWEACMVVIRGHLIQ